MSKSLTSTKRPFLKLLIKSSLALLFWCVLPGMAIAQSSNPTDNKSLIKPLDIGAVPNAGTNPILISGEANFQEPLLPDGAPIYWTRLIFQSHRDGNWEIYGASHYGNDQVNLTTHPSADARARLNRGATQIAFNSDRSGNHEIYIMNSDGSGIYPVTASSDPDYAAAWSPDSRSLAFVSERDGNAEIYTIDRVNLTTSRLTFDSAIDEFPIWSPDGSQIAWVRMINDVGTIWVMNKDGTNPQAIYAGQFLQHPSWSPDGTRLAFDADIDGDVWNELGSINLDGTGLQILYDVNEAQREAWMGNWSEDGNWITFSYIYYVINENGDLIIEMAYVYRLQIGEQPAQLTSTYMDLLPDWQLMDLEAPVTNVTSLPAFSRESGFYVNWQGSDSGPSGIEGYDIQYRIGENGNWTDWQTNTLIESALYSGSAGDKVYFRSRAEDAAGNIENWPELPRGDTATTLFTWLFSGLTMDNRDTPIPIVPLTISPRALSSVNSSKRGIFLARLTETGEHNIQANQIGYGEIDPLLLNITTDIDYKLLFPPPDDIVTNGNFESDGNQLNGWIVGGTLPVVPTNTVVHSGNYGVSLGIDCKEPCLTDPETVTEISLNMVQPKIVVDNENNVHTVWAGKFRIFYYSYRSPQGGWSEPSVIGNAGGWSSALSLDMAIDSLNNLHVTWNGGEESFIYYTEKPASGSWSVPVAIGGGLLPKIVADHENNIYVLYGGMEGFEYRKKTSAGTWDPPVNLGNGYSSCEGAISVSNTNEVHFIWCGVEDLFYRSLSPDGVLSSIYTISTKFAAEEKLAEVDSNGNLWIVWSENINYYEYETGRYIIKSADDSWSLPADIPGIVYATGMKFDRHNNLHIFGGEDDNCKYVQHKPNAGWVNPVPVDDDICLTSLSLDTNDQKHLIKPDISTVITLSYRTTRIAEQSEQGSIQQTITIPTDTHKASLSWMHQTVRQMDENPAFTIDISSNSTTTQVFSSTATNDWTHGWVDVSQWANQTITLTLTVHQTTNEPFVHLYLDDISLGSWLTPIISDVTPSSFKVWETEVITITGNNFIQTPTIKLNDVQVTEVEWFDEQNMRIILPTGLPIGIYDIWVSNPGGQQGVLPAGLRLGWITYLPIIGK